MRKIVVFLSTCLLSLSAYATMATPEPIVKMQADGTTITLRLVGDEFHSYYTNLEGTPLRLNKKGMWVEDARVAVMPERARKARRVAQQTMMSSTYPLIGSPKSLVILVNYTDLKFRYTQQNFQDMLSKSGYSDNGAVGSCRDYFIACSDSIFRPQFDCYGPVELSHKMEYYDTRASQMIVEACNLLDEQGIDLTQYDTDNDGKIDNVFVYYAGHNEAEGGPSNSIWPHRSVVTSGDRVQGKLIYDYACTSELRGSAGTTMCGIGTFCHEFGHVLGLPDYYDTSDGTSQYTIGSWDIMCSGNYNGNGRTPPTHTAGERFQLGWVTPIQLKDAGSYTLAPVESSSAVYLIAKSEHNLSFDEASPNEYWLLENRQHVGWDAPSTALAATGLLIWHVDYNATAWGANRPNNSQPLRYDLEEADGVKGYAAASDPFPGSKKITTFTPVLHSGEILDQPLLKIEEDGQNISFMFKSNAFMFLPTDMPVIKSTYNPDTKKAYTPGELLKIAGESLDPEQPVYISISGKGFAISTDSLNWTTDLQATIAPDSTLDFALYVRYAPGKQICDIQRGTVKATQGSKTGSFNVYGTSPRPVLIEAPYIDQLEDVTPTTFKVHWIPQEDAEEYYVTLYHMEEGHETMMESFEGFDDEQVVKESGWYTSFFRTTTKAKDDGAVSLWFKENNEQIISPIYTQPVVELSMWLNAPATTDTEVGFFELVAYGEAGIDTLERITVNKNTKQYVYKQTFDEELQYRRFSLQYVSIGGEGVCLDAFTTTFTHKTVYTYQGRERTIIAQDGEEAGLYTVFYADDLIPDTDYYIALQCSENKGCEEHLSELSQVFTLRTKKGESADSQRLTLDVDSISYDPAQHVIYLPQSKTNGYLNIYSSEGELVKSIPVGATHNVIPLTDDEFRRGSVYLVKYLPDGKMNRKSPWIKILFR